MILNSRGNRINPIVNETDGYGRKFKYGFTNEKIELKNNTFVKKVLKK